MKLNKKNNVKKNNVKINSKKTKLSKSDYIKYSAISKKLAAHNISTHGQLQSIVDTMESPNSHKKISLNSCGNYTACKIAYSANDIKVYGLLKDHKIDQSENGYTDLFRTFSMFDIVTVRIIGQQSNKKYKMLPSPVTKKFVFCGRFDGRKYNGFNDNEKKEISKNALLISVDSKEYLVFHNASKHLQIVK